MNNQLIITVLSIIISTVATSFVVINFLLARIDKLDDKLSTRIDKLDNKIDQVEQRLELKITSLQEAFANVRIEIAKLEVYIFGGGKSFKPKANQLSDTES